MNNNTNCTIYLVRHAETEMNAQRIYQGDTDTELNERGKREAKKLAEKFKPVKFEAVFSSDLMRAKQTAELVTLHHQLTVITHKALRERSLGEFDGKSINEYQKKLKKQLNELDLLSDEEVLDYQFPSGMESYGSVATRTINFLRELALGYPGKTLLVVSHGGVVRHTLVKLGYATYAQLPSYSIDNLGYFKVESDGVDFWVKETEGINFHE